MPFQSKAQMKAAFGGHLGPTMKKKAKTWASLTPSISKLPEHKLGGKPKDMQAFKGLKTLKKGK